MRILTVILSLLGFATGGAIAAPPDASDADLAALTADLEVLENDLARIESDEGELASDLTDRVEAIRNEAIYLKVKMRKHRDRGGGGSGVTRNEIEELRGAIGELRADLKKASETVVVDGRAAVPVGTQIGVRLGDSLSTATAKEGDRFRATTIVPLAPQGEELVPAGTLLEGTLERVDRPEGRMDRSARLLLVFDRIEIHGRFIPLTATVVSASEKMETGIGDEKAKMGVGAGIGAVLGAVIGGKRGAVAGIVLGGSGAILATEGNNVELPPGTVLNLRLDRELVLP